MLIDTHIHLDLYQNTNIDELVDEALQKGVKILIDVGIDILSSRLAVKFAEKYSNVYAVTGIHPHEAKFVNEKTLEELKALVNNPKIVAVGEIGLDYYRNLSPKDLQKKAFLAQLNLAKSLDLPVVVHDRDAHEDVIKMLKEVNFPSGKVLIHCFSGDVNFLNEVLKMGYYISIGGPVTFKNAKKVVEVVKNVPLERLLLETDGPYLAPHPHRGKINRPVFIPLIAQKIADIRGISFAEIEKATTENALKFFGIKV
ncbi:TatD family hydrolase [Candidatus Oleimmundimicrobium sp.]|uniref:TatD family hydrolase n=1 Tax=Candidatus Oleimmundimicrobium sp. TaxID=3060597 RepID=UPI0027279A81|nr:TatD family hydrolase [Candidatus Oleimmundimicrobium sp.]MDO8886309.1 TatD family hydrolase [Candidatus Oleimmundimicrobium sp.]